MLSKYLGVIIHNNLTGVNIQEQLVVSKENSLMKSSHKKLNMYVI